MEEQDAADRTYGQRRPERLIGPRRQAWSLGRCPEGSPCASAGPAVWEARIPGSRALQALGDGLFSGHSIDGARCCLIFMTQVLFFCCRSSWDREVSRDKRQLRTPHIRSWPLVQKLIFAQECDREIGWGVVATQEHGVWTEDLLLQAREPSSTEEAMPEVSQRRATRRRFRCWTSEMRPIACGFVCCRWRCGRVPGTYPLRAPIGALLSPGRFCCRHAGRVLASGAGSPRLEFLSIRHRVWAHGLPGCGGSGDDGSVGGYTAGVAGAMLTVARPCHWVGKTPSIPRPIARRGARPSGG